MEPRTFSVLINGTVRIDDLEIERAVKYSGTLRNLFSLPDSEAPKRIRRGEPICIELLCRDPIDKMISVPLLRWLFGLFRAGGCVEKIYCSLNDYRHGLQILSLLDASCTDVLTEMVVIQCSFREVVQAVQLMYRALSRDLQSHLKTDLGKELEGQFKYDSGPLAVPCRAAMDLILQGVDFDAGVRSIRDSILETHPGDRYYHWNEEYVALSHSAMTLETAEDLIHLETWDRLGFLFFVEEKRAIPVGVFVLRLRYQSEKERHYFFRQWLPEWNRQWSQSEIVLYSDKCSSPTFTTEPLLWMEPYCVVNENMYRDAAFVAQVMETLGTTLDQIREAQVIFNKNIP